MHNVIVGTAGHVDHGKTWLIKALTGTDTDRLKEEKIRGITIELGFAELPNPNGQHIGIVDVPGHEKFVRNMLAGIGGIDIVLLVIAADEGIMPQTVEHFEILKMLDIKKGVIVITKSDKVDQEWLLLVEEEIQEAVRDTFLEKAPLIQVSSKTGKNIEELKEIIYEMAKDISNRKTDPLLFRLPVDRVFTIDGFGTVVTGTLMEGSVSVGDEVQIYPGDRTVKVRSLQFHGATVDTAYAGQRTAINLLNIKKEEIQRGDVIAAKGSLMQTMMLDVKLKIFDDAKRTLRNESRVHLYYGSAETLCKVILLDHDTLENGDEGYAQLRLEEEVAVRKGDRFIVRFYSPVETIGGGQILDAVPFKHKRFRKYVLEALKIKEEGNTSSVLEQTILENRKALYNVNELIVKLGMTEADKKRDLDELVGKGRIIKLSEDIVIHTQAMEEIGKDAKGILNQYHRKNPISVGMQKNEFRKRLSDKSRINNAKIIELVLRYLEENGVVKEKENRVSLIDFTVTYSEKHIGLRKQILEEYSKYGFEIPESDEIIPEESDREIIRRLIESLAAEGFLKKMDFKHYMHFSYWNKAMNLLQEYIKHNGRITLAEYRDLLQTSRKYAVMILEYLDEQAITIMYNDARVLSSLSRKEK